MPIFLWELSVGVWLTFKGFNRAAPILAGSEDDRRAVPGAARSTSTAAEVSA
jgi:hypothetical protein